ncbi:NAD-dependent protein deacetylase [Lachnellula arida]|uniref:NAD-dependent protein deacetylase n=1 Tax=Lachnellula arida TaxID=1316785 RepID=A0A8T9BHE4_9HELO|nr:NAD-dependent protein deacetylase [Lachnellula arida]
MDDKTVKTKPRAGESCKVHKRTGKVPVLRPRVWLYLDDDYPDADAISSVADADLQKKLDVVIVVGTALKIKSAKKLAKDMCIAVRRSGGIAVWINLKTPTPDLDCFDLVIEGDCETVAMHISTWWLKVPLVLSDSQIQHLQQRCKALFIARSPEAALNRALAELDTESLSRIFQQDENKSKILNAQENGKLIFGPAERSRITSSSDSKAKLGWKTVNQPLLVLRGTPSQSPGILPKLLDCWRIEISKRLSEVVIKVVIRKTGKNQTEKVRESSTVVTKIIKLGYRVDPEKSLWRLKQGEYLNDEILNAYLELLQRSVVNQENYHWSFAVIESKNKEDAIQWTYYDSIGAGAPAALLDWIQQWFYGKTIKELTASPNPEQNNGTDCGLFVLMGIRLLIAGRPHLTQAESNGLLPSIRERVLAELLASSLDPSEAQYQELKLKETNAKETPPQFTEDSNGDDSDCVIVPARLDNQDHSNQLELFVSQSQASDSSSSGGDEKTSPEHIASEFARESTMLSTLREAVAIERATQKQHSNLATENLELAKLWVMIRTEKRALKQRYIHYEFSRQFWAVMKDFNRGPHERGPVPKATILKVMDKLEITDRADWKYLLQRARRASFWTELVEIFKGDLEHSSVVLCAVPNTTYRLETLTMSNRKLLFEGIRSRLEDPGNGIMARLKAADSLYWALMHNGLPTRDLPIESANEVLPFEQMVRTGK